MEGLQVPRAGDVGREVTLEQMEQLESGKVPVVVRKLAYVQK